MQKGNAIKAEQPSQVASCSPKASLWEIFWVFSKIGLFTFGGGLAMLPLVQKAVTEQKHWMNDDDFIDMLAITNSLPGAFAINAAIYIGYQQRKLTGAFAGAFGTILPSFIIILIIAHLLLMGQDVVWLEKFFNGVRPAVVALIIDAAFKLGKKSIKNRLDIALLIIGTLLVAFTGIHPALVILAGAAIGLIYYRDKTITKEEK